VEVLKLRNLPNFIPLDFDARYRQAGALYALNRGCKSFVQICRVAIELKPCDAVAS
jgi:hypothetical protein